MRIVCAAAAAALAAGGATAQMKIVALPSKSPLVTFRVVFLTGAASDPADKPGTAALTAALLAQGGTRQMSYQEILDAFFPMAVSVGHHTDKEMTAFSATTHVDNLEKFYAIFRAMLLEPGWRDDDFKRLRDDAVNFLRVNLRDANEEELAKEVLYNEIYTGHPYGHHNVGTVSGLNKLTIEDLKRFYGANYTQSNLILGIAGGYPPDFVERMKKDFAALPAGKPRGGKQPPVRPLRGIRVTMIEKETRSVAISLGFPIAVRRGHPDFPALLVAQSYFGPHRMSGGRLYNRMRELRGLNYGDYAYIEYFPRGMFRLEPEPNLARRSQIFQIWIRPVEPPNAHFALRLALYELDRLIRHGLTPSDFERTRTFLSKYVNLLLKTQDAQLGYAIDSLYYGIPDYLTYIKSALPKLTVEEVNRAIRKHLRTTDLHIVIVAKNCEQLRKRLITGEPSPIEYNAPKPQDLLEEDKVVERWPIPLKPEAVRVLPVERVFE
ncbi:MAG: pitrilysin family protein [Bryobacterales bacterium]|nr:insulinase family protein [Bryobacteraceae bacterium]MDW8353494.1 pitrilysin family protein [Bryobacterales bacterium]